MPKWYRFPSWPACFTENTEDRDKENDGNKSKKYAARIRYTILESSILLPDALGNDININASNLNSVINGHSIDNVLREYGVNPSDYKESQ